MSTSPEDQRRIRAAENQSLFREVNERVQELNTSFQMVTEIAEWVCECEDTACVERIPMTLREYAQLRSDGNFFAVKAGHEVPELETVVERHGKYFVIAKMGAGGRYAIAHDPRASA